MSQNSLPARLLSALEPHRQATAWHIAFSGGLDSTVLLHLLAQLSRTHAFPGLNAIHVHHGLQTVADAWPGHCQSVCAQLGVPFSVIRVRIQPGASIERAAREARYEAFAELTGHNEILLTAQHRDDQAETLLFRLLRGAGVRGLAGIPRARAMGEGYLLRPLLDVSRAELQAYAGEHQLSWVEDPSNDDHQFSRNYLRHQVLPVLTRRWPQAVATIARSAQHLVEAQELLDDLAVQDLAADQRTSRFSWLNLPSLDLEPLVSLSDSRQRNALRYWLAPLTRLPDADHWAGWVSLSQARHDSQPVWRLFEGELHRADGHVWWLAGAWLQTPQGFCEWPDTGEPLVLPGNGSVRISGIPPDGILQVRYRQGGEVLHLPQRGHRDLKRLFNESGVPHFARGRLPLLYCDDRLLAVANLSGLDGSAFGEWRFEWMPVNHDQGLS